MEERIKHAIDEIVENRLRRIQSKSNVIPIGFNRAAGIIPGIMRKTYYIITAGPGIGKTRFVKSMFVFNAVNYAMQHKDVNLKIFYFCLEETAERFIQSIIIHRLYKEHKIRLSLSELLSYSHPEKQHVMDEGVIDKIKSCESYLKEFFRYVILIDDVKNPFGIYKTVRDYFSQHGELIKKEVEFTENGKKFTKVIPVKYIPYDKHQFVGVIIDHIGLIEPEGGLDLRSSIQNLSSRYLVRLRNTYGAFIIAVQQQTAEKEKEQFTYRGESIEKKLEPSMDGLGDSKSTSRDADIILGIFSPAKYEIEMHNGYNIRLLKDNYRSINIIKNRDDASFIKIPMYFDGGTYITEEMVTVDKMDKKMYDYYANRSKK